jgi:succinoglycan biosynthesis protein ExoL
VVENRAAPINREDDPAGENRKSPLGRSARVAYFGPDLDDPAVKRRVAQWRFAGFDVLAAAFARRRSSAERNDGTINLGLVTAQSRMRRIVPLAVAGFRLIVIRKQLRGIEIFVARNLDNAFLALFARWITGSTAPLIYEILDVNPSCTAMGWQGAFLRKLEGWILAHSGLLLVSSPFFISDYYQKLLGFRGASLLFENKVPSYARLSRTPALDATPPSSSSGTARRWRIGWFGYLDDERSWHILRRVATALPDQVSLYIRGMPYANFDMENFLRDISEMDNADYGGPFRNPEDLAAIYNAVDIVWSADCNELTANSKWLLTNGIYEAGYFGKPVIGLAGTAVGEFLEDYESGWCIGHPADEQLMALLDALTPEEYHRKLETIAALPPDSFAETDEIETIWSFVRNVPLRHVASDSAPRPKAPRLLGRRR